MTAASTQQSILNRMIHDPGFLLCAICLILSTVVVSSLGIQHKLPLPLKKPLDQLDESRLLPFQVRYKSTIDNEDMLKELGTHDYITWNLNNFSPSPSDAYSSVNLFITYYTGDPGLVPHIPDICYLGGGYSINHASYSTITVNSQDIPLKLLEVSKKQSDGSQSFFTIGYFFMANDQYFSNRHRVRFELNDPQIKYAYFSKIEFTVQDALKQPSPDQVLPLIQKLSEKLIPVLEQDHFPVIPDSIETKPVN